MTNYACMRKAITLKIKYHLLPKMTETNKIQNVLILFKDKDHVYVEAGGHVVQLNKEDGSVKLDFIPARHRASNVCVGNNILITGSCPTV